MKRILREGRDRRQTLVCNRVAVWNSAAGHMVAEATMPSMGLFVGLWFGVFVSHGLYYVRFAIICVVGN